MPAVLKIFWIQEKPAYKSFFIFQNISKTTNVLKNHGQCFFKLHDALDIYKKKKKKKNKKQVIMSTSFEAGQDFDFST